MSDLARKILKGSSAIAVAQLIANFSAFLLPWAIARGMGESDYGLYATAYALAVSLAAIADTGIRVTLIREVSLMPMLWKFLVKYALLTSMGVACLVILVFLATTFMQDESTVATQLRFWLLGYALLWTAMRISLGVVVGHQQLVASAVWGSIERLGGTILVILIAFSPSADLILIAKQLLFWELLVLVVLWWWMLKQPWESSPESSVSFMDFAKAAVPFGVAAVATGLLSRMDLVILGFQKKPEEIASYAAGQTLSLILVFVGISIASTLFPMISSLNKEKNVAQARKLIEPSIALLALIMLLSGTFISAGAQLWMTWIYGENFSDGAKWLILYAMMSPLYALGAVIGSVVSAWGWQPKAARWAIGALLLATPMYWLMGQWFGMSGIVFCVMLTQLILTHRAWTWMVRDHLVSDGWWFLKLVALQLLLGTAILATPGWWDWLYVPLALLGAIVFGVCKLVWLKKLNQFMFVRKSS